MHRIEDKDITLTPLNLIESLGTFDLDPCGVPHHLTAREIISLPRNGLLEPWRGRVWLNPPYSNPSPWLQKLSEHGHGTALVLNSTDAKWFHDFGLNRASGMFLLKGRPKFMRLDGSRVSIMRGVVLFAYGEYDYHMLQRCSSNGVFIDLSGVKDGAENIFKVYNN